MDGNSFKFLNKETLGNKYLENLQEISLSSCNIERVSDKAFSTMKHITHVNLSYNKLVQLPADLFMGNTDLQTLDFSGNQISSLIAYQLPPLFSLKKIDFSSNRLKRIHPKAFFNLGPTIETLDLRDNHLQVLFSETFLHLHQLKVKKDERRHSLICL